MEHLDDPISELTWPQHRPDWFNNMGKRNNGQKRKADDNLNEVTRKKLKLEQHQGSTSRQQEDPREERARKYITIKLNVGTDKLQYNKRKIRVISQERTANFSVRTFTNDNVIHII